MKKSVLLIAAGALAFSSAASAQNFTYEITWEPVEAIGGLMGPDGREYGGGVVNGTYVTTVEDGTTRTGNVKCVGTGQPDGGIFAIHLACTSTSSEGLKANMAYGCNYIGKPGPETPLGCVAGIQHKQEDGTYANGSATLYWYSEANAKGTGQWYAQ